MRRRFSNLPRPVLAALLVFVTAFAFFSATTQELTGYEPETGAVVEGFVLHGHFWDVEDSPLPLKAGFLGRGGHHYALSGLLQTLGQVPFFAAGHFVDANFGSLGGYPFGYVFLWFYNPFMAAIAAVALFALVFMTRGSIKWATVIAGLFIVASIAWPYSKIGMETTFMAASLVAFALAVWARGRPTVATWALTGFAGGAAVANKPYAALVLLGIAILLWPTFRAADGRRRMQLVVAAALPLLFWAAAIGWYNWVRFGSPLDSGYHEALLTLAMPLNVFGLFFSPGKGLIFYSPLIVLGALGLPRLWRQDRHLTTALLIFLLGLTAACRRPDLLGRRGLGAAVPRSSRLGAARTDRLVGRQRVSPQDPGGGGGHWRIRPDRRSLGAVRALSGCRPSPVGSSYLRRPARESGSRRHSLRR